MQRSVEFYATPAEISAWLGHVHTRTPLQVAAIRFFPFRAVSLPSTWKPDAITALDSSVKALWIDITPLSTVHSAHSACASANRQRLEIQLPEQRPDGLRVGCAATRSDDPERLRIWNSVLRQIRHHTTAGMWVLNPDTGAKGFYRRLRYSAAIVTLVSQGLSLLPVAGTNRVFLTEPRTA